MVPSRRTERDHDIVYNGAETYPGRIQHGILPARFDILWEKLLKGLRVGPVVSVRQVTRR